MAKVAAEAKAVTEGQNLADENRHVLVIREQQQRNR